MRTLTAYCALLAAALVSRAFAAGWTVDASAKTLTYADANDATVWQFGCTFGGTGSKDITLSSIKVSPSVATDVDFSGIPDGYAVVNLGNVFQGCYKVSSVREPNRLTTLNNYAFYSYGNDTTLTNFTGGGAVTSCGQEVFRCRKGLRSDMAFPLLTAIPNGLFNSCAALKSFSAPLATKVGSSAFDSCTGMTNLVLNWSEMTAIEDGGLSKCGAIKGDYVMPLLTRFGGMRNTDVTKVDAPNVTWLGTYAFFQCGSLTNITIGPKVTSVQNADGRTFESCSKLKGDLCFDLLSSVPPAFFSGCSAITSASFTNASVVGSQAFMNCSAMTNFYYTPAIVKTIGEHAFVRTHLTGHWNFPEVTTLGGFKWSTIASLSAPKTKILSANAFYAVSTLTSLDLGHDIETVSGDQTFTNCGNLTGDFDFSQVASFPMNFMSGTKVGSVRLDSATSFGSNAFSSTPLTNIVLGAATALPASLFDGAKNGCMVHFLGDVPTFGSKTFATTGLVRFYVHGKDYLDNWSEACFALRGSAAYEPYAAGAPRRTIGVMYGNSDTSTQATTGRAYVINGNHEPTVFSIR